MNKRERLKWIKRVWNRLQGKLSEAFEAKDELNFDWYSDGFQTFWCILRDKPIELVKRVKPL